MRRPGIMAILGTAVATGWASLCPADQVIRMYPANDMIDYTPSRDMTPSVNNPHPHNHIQILADRWQALHPGVRIEFVRMPTAQGRWMENYRAWCMSNFMAGTIPHIVFQNMGSYRDADYDNGWVVPVDRYLERPNRYVEGNRRWRDLFYEPWLNAMRSADGHLYWIAPDTIGVGTLVNMDILKTCGIDAPPETFGQFIDICETVRSKGHIAYLAMYEWYSNCVMPAVIWADRIPQMDVIRRDGIVDPAEQALAIDRGLFSCRGERMHEYLRLTDRLYDQYPRGYHIMDELYLFRTGRVAMMEGLSIQMRQIAEDPDRDFEFRVAPFPDITAADSRFGGHPLAGKSIAGYTSTWQITNRAVREGLVDLCVDWLMYLTTPENSEALVNELGYTIPGVRGAQPATQMFRELLDRATADIERPDFLAWHAFNPFTYTPEFDVNWTRTKECLALDMISIPETMERLDFWLQRSHKMFKRKHCARVADVNGNAP